MQSGEEGRPTILGWVLWWVHHGAAPADPRLGERHVPPEVAGPSDNSDKLSRTVPDVEQMEILQLNNVTTQ